MLRLRSRTVTDGDAGGALALTPHDTARAATLDAATAPVASFLRAVASALSQLDGHRCAARQRRQHGAPDAHSSLSAAVRALTDAAFAAPGLRACALPSCGAREAHESH
jgi:hypothetical protein